MTGMLARSGKVEGSMEWITRIKSAISTLASQRGSPRMNLPSDQALIERAVLLSGFSKCRPEDIEFYVEAHRSEGLDPRSIRKRGTLLTKEQVKTRDIAFRGHLTEEYLATLNDDGLSDPVGAAWVIVRHANSLICCAKDLKRTRDANIDLVRFRASNMAAGPCPKAAALNDQRITIDKVEIVPFEECTHPDQCACLYQAWLPLMDEFFPDD